MDKEILTISGASRITKLSTQWLRVLADRGELPSIKNDIGQRLFFPMDLENFMRERHAECSKFKASKA